MAEPKTEYELRLERIESAIMAMTHRLLTNTAFDIQDAEKIEHILKGEKSDSETEKFPGGPSHV